MARIIKLTLPTAGADQDIFVNVDYIESFTDAEDNLTRLVIKDRQQVLFVKQSCNDIVVAINS